MAIYSNKMQKGVLTFLGNGFGNVQSEDRQELFFHVSALQNCEFKELKKGQTIEFTLDPKLPNVIDHLWKLSV